GIQIDLRIHMRPTRKSGRRAVSIGAIERHLLHGLVAPDLPVDFDRAPVRACAKARYENRDRLGILELRDKHIARARAGQTVPTKMGWSGEVARHHHGAGLIHVHSVAAFARASPKAMAPRVRSVRIEPGDEDVRLTGRIQRSTAEVRGTANETRNNDAPV